MTVVMNMLMSLSSETVPGKALPSQHNSHESEHRDRVQYPSLQIVDDGEGRRLSGFSWFRNESSLQTESYTGRRHEATSIIIIKDCKAHEYPSK